MIVYFHLKHNRNIQTFSVIRNQDHTQELHNISCWTGNYCYSKGSKQINKGSVKSDFELCSITPNEDVISILGRKDQTDCRLTLDVLFIKEIAPVLNTKDEFRSKTLTLKCWNLVLIWLVMFCWDCSSYYFSLENYVSF